MNNKSRPYSIQCIGCYHTAITLLLNLPFQRQDSHRVLGLAFGTGFARDSGHERHSQKLQKRDPGSLFSRLLDIPMQIMVHLLTRCKFLHCRACCSKITYVAKHTTTWKETLLLHAAASGMRQNLARPCTLL